MTDGIAQRPGSTRAARPSGTIRGTFPGRPPPVTWAIPCRSRPSPVERTAARIARSARA